MNDVLKNPENDIFTPLIKRISGMRDGSIVAIDGGSGSGKTTLAARLGDMLDATVFHMDDFFLPPEMRTPERLGQAGGNVHRERFLDEVLLPIKRGDTVCFRPFDCSIGAFGEVASIEPKGLIIVEGAYSLHPELESFYDLRVFLDISPEMQRQRILGRCSAENALQFFERWIVLENIYFEKTHIKKRCDLIFEIK